MNNDFKKPLLQSLAVLGGAILFFGIVSSSSASSTGGGFLTAITSIGSLILFVIGLAVGLMICVGIMIGIFLAAVGMVAPDQASAMYADLKKKSSLQRLTQSNCCADASRPNNFELEEYERMKEQIATLQTSSKALQEKIKALTGDNDALNANVDSLSKENSSLKNDIVDLQEAVSQLQDSEDKIKAQLANLETLAASQHNDEISAQLDALNKLQSTLSDDLGQLNSRLTVIEGSFKQAPVSGIFSYIENEDQRNLFSQKVEEALSKELTYTQIDEFLTANLPAELDEIIKSHPSLTKNYIRNLRRD